MDRIDELKVAYSDGDFDDVRVEGDRQLTILLHLEQHVEEVFDIAAAAAAHPLQVLLDDAVEDPEGGVKDLLAAAHGAAEPADDPGGRPQVGRVEPGREHDGAVEHVLEGLAVLEPVAHRGAHRDVRDERGQLLAHVRGAGARRRGGARAQHGGDLLLADGAEGEDAARAEELVDGDPAELPPVGPVGRHDDAPAAVGERPHGGAQRPRREHRVVRPHHLPRRLPGRHHQRGHLADPEQHERPVAPREVAHRVVRELADHVVQAADDRQLPWPGRQPQTLLERHRGAPALGEHGEQGDESQSEVDEVVLVCHWCCSQCKLLVTGVALPVSWLLLK
ncbi:hypothetical protein PVAP13_6NG075030 [Panicum virgatum]|uniref:Uncharacterized protein n=1 Tax=Panicum virgatum TaxID=38727 RepID=A0A8T0QV87_PANVG|nr:hypothetical protein PVAP13_6NG075030 [Panicum virgatum]